MRAINHSLTGAIIGLSVGSPVALPLALASHYVLDVIPHSGNKTSDEYNRKWVKSRLFAWLLLIDAALCGLLVLVLAVTQPQHWPLAALCAFVAAAPDFLSVNYFRQIKTVKPWQPNLYTRFAHGIQWFEKPIGALVEVAWFVAGIILLGIYI
jgi:hypothetical protein